MKKNTGYWLAFAAGLAVAGTAAVWLNSRRGRNAKEKIAEKGEEILDDAEEILTDTRERFEHLRADLKKGFGRNSRKKEDISGEVVM
jgi:gas vesicle protein